MLKETGSHSATSTLDLAAHQRFDIPTSALPAGTVNNRIPVAPGPFAGVTEWIGRLAAIVAAVLVVVVVISIQKGLKVQHSARAVVDNFHTTNQYFAQRADLNAPATARQELEQLKGVLMQLNTSTAADTNQLGDLLPNMRALLAAGQGDTSIAHQLQGVAGSLAGAAGSLHKISADADTTVTDVDNQLTEAIALAGQLNAQLGRTTDKLAPIPGQGAVIPAPGGTR